jgi:hypothetical protein
MPSKKSVRIPEIGEVRICKKKRMKSIRLRVDHDGQVIVSVPRWIMLGQAVGFVKSKKDWILSEKLKTDTQLYSGMSFGNGIRLSISPGETTRPSAKLTADTLKLTIPKSYSDKRSQAFINKKINDVLKRQAENSLLPRLRFLADNCGIKYASASVRILKSRWGSCDSKSNIKLNAYLLQLPDELIDYVLLHELNHVNHMNHSQGFWKAMDEMCPDTKKYKKQIKSHSPRLKTIMP